MLENVCAFPLDAELFALAVHPSRPLLAIGLASGHVECLALPPSPAAAAISPSPPPVIRGSSRRSSLSNPSFPSSQVDGKGLVRSLWRTKRHKGSCRAVAFTHDGEAAYSAGTDGLVKRFSCQTGLVESKLLVPASLTSGAVDAPTVLQPLGAEILALACDSGKLLLYDLRAAPDTVRPAQTYVPHDDYVSALAPLPSLDPNSAAATATVRQLVSTGGTTLAVTDTRRGVLARSDDQRDELLCAHLLPTHARRARRAAGPAPAPAGMVAVGTASGVLTLWERGQWADQHERIVVDIGRMRGTEGESIDALASDPAEAPDRLFVGLGDGRIRLVDLAARRPDPLHSWRHDDLDGVTALAFDSDRRLISAGGSTVKIWQLLDSDPEQHHSDPDPSDDPSDDTDTDTEIVRDQLKRARPQDDSSSDLSDSDPSQIDPPTSARRRARRRKQAASRGRLGPMGDHGVLRVDGLD